MCFLVLSRKRRKNKTFALSKAVLVSISYIILLNNSRWYSLVFIKILIQEGKITEFPYFGHSNGQTLGY